MNFNCAKKQEKVTDFKSKMMPEPHGTSHTSQSVCKEKWKERGDGYVQGLIWEISPFARTKLKRHWYLDSGKCNMQA